MKQTLKFLGCGSAFNTKLGNSSAYFTNNNRLILIDCGSDVFSKLKNNKILENKDEINVFITHLHSDHVGSLGDLILYCYFILGKKVNVIYPDREIIENYLSLIGCDGYYNLYQDNKFKSLEFLFIKSEHVKEINSYSISFSILKDSSCYSIFYSGDCNQIDFDYLLAYDEIYIDTCIVDYPNNVHFNIEKLNNIVSSIPDKSLRDKIYCYHLDNNKELINKISEYGFKFIQPINYPKFTMEQAEKVAEILEKFEDKLTEIGFVKNDRDDVLEMAIEMIKDYKEMIE